MVQIETKKLNIDNKFKKKLSCMFANKYNNKTPVSLGTSTSTPISKKKNNRKFKKKIPIKNESNTIKNKKISKNNNENNEENNDNNINNSNNSIENITSINFKNIKFDYFIHFILKEHMERYNEMKKELNNLKIKHNPQLKKIYLYLLIMFNEEYDEFTYKIDEKNDQLKLERENALKLILETFQENLSKSENEIKIYSPYKHGDLKIINTEIIKK